MELNEHHLLDYFRTLNHSAFISMLSLIINSIIYTNGREQEAHSREKGAAV